MPLIDKQFEKDRYTARFLVDEEYENIRLDQFIKNNFPNFSREFIKKKIYAGEVVIDGRQTPHRPSSKIHYGEIITMFTHKSGHEDEYWNGKKIELDSEPEIIYEDDGLLVVSKPPFMATHPTGKHLFNCATVVFESIYKRTIHSIHRLDRETSGILLLAKSPQTAKVMTDHFENNLVRKCYFFIAKLDESVFKNRNEFTADENLGPKEAGLKRVQIHAFPANGDKGKTAVTEFKVLHIEKGYALGLAFPQTGRQHQIRVHAMVHGLPLIGDKIYLGGFKMFQRFKDKIATDEDHDLMEIPRHALHAIALQTPYKKESKLFISSLPADFTTWIKATLKLDVQELLNITNKEIKNYLRG